MVRAGVYGLRTAAGRVTPVARGERGVVLDAEAARLVALGVAAYAEATAAPVPPPCGEEPAHGSMDTHEEKSAVQAPTDGEKAEADGVEVARLERMPKADLEQLAKDMGVDLSGAKNNRERAVLIAAAGTLNDDEALPDLGTGDIVQ